MFLRIIMANVCTNFCILFVIICNVQCKLQGGPDPWDLQGNNKVNEAENGLDIPPDLRSIPKKQFKVGIGAGPDDWFYKRLLAIMLKAGHVKRNDDGTVTVSLHMKFNDERWQVLEGYTTSQSALSEDMIRRSLGYVEEAIYKPTVVMKVILTWSEYIQMYLIEYKMYITWTLGVLASSAGALWLWNHISHKHVFMILFLILYLYEVFTSYKEAENEELQRFLSAVNKCKWNFWSSHCDMPTPDPLIFIKHMNPIKIGMRMFTNVITGPIIPINDTLKILLHGITDGLWSPLDKIVNSILILIFNVLLIFFLIMILYNYILNIPTNINFFGLFNIFLNKRNRSFNTNATETTKPEDSDKATGAILNRALDICSQALCVVQSAQNNQKPLDLKEQKLHLNSSSFPGPANKIRRSASTGRLHNTNGDFSYLQIENSTNLSKKSSKEKKLIGGGDVC